MLECAIQVLVTTTLLWVNAPVARLEGPTMSHRPPMTRTSALAVVIATLMLLSPARAQDAINVGQVEIDPPTYCCLGVSLEVLSGDDNYNATVSVSYREVGGNWQSAMPLLRVRPETVPFGFGSDIEEQFAGSIFNLSPGRSYEIQLDVEDPDGGNATRVVNVSTRALPPTNPSTPRTINVDSLQTWQAALDQAQPGDVINVSNGTYTGALTVTRSGTADDPIFIRGETQSGVVLDANGQEHGIVIHTGTGGPPVRHVILENFTIRGSEWGIRILGAEDVVVQYMTIDEVTHGINATTYVENEGRAYPNANLTICDNVLEGNSLPWPFFEVAAFNVEGIVLEGSGHVVCHNTLSGFGDSLGIEICYGGLSPDYCPLYPPPHRSTVRNRAIDFYGNDVLWGGDDGIELDFGERNVRAFKNRISNTGMGVSFQVVWGGPVYAIQNVMYNIADRTYKLNNEPSGFYIVHNTSIREGLAWNQPSPSQVIQNMKFWNNLLVGSASAGALSLRTFLVMDTATNNIVEMDYDGWYPDGAFTFLSENFGRATYSDILDLSNNTPLEQNGVALTTPIFESADHVLDPIAAPPLDPVADISLHPSSNAIDRGVVLPNINDGFSGSAPDLGALERGVPMPSYGVRPRPGQDTLPPAAPTGLQAD